MVDAGTADSVVIFVRPDRTVFEFALANTTVVRMSTATVTTAMLKLGRARAGSVCGCKEGVRLGRKLIRMNTDRVCVPPS